MEKLSTQEFVEKKYNLFEDVANNYQNLRNVDDVVYTILNYEQILGDMCEFITGYLKYKEDGNTTYAGKVLPTTISFYNTMFTHDKYRTTMVLHEMKEINKTFLSKTKQLQTLLENCKKILETSDDKELKQLLLLTNNQYKKLSKVYSDDMEIYLWLSTSNSKTFRRDISVDLRVAFGDKSTPVIHKK